MTETSEPTPAVSWTEQGETLWTGRGERHHYTAVQVQDYGPDRFPWALWRTDPDRPSRRKGDPASGLDDCLRVTNVGWCWELAEMWERTGIKPDPEHLHEVVVRLARQADA